MSEVIASPEPRPMAQPDSNSGRLCHRSRCAQLSNNQNAALWRTGGQGNSRQTPRRIEAAGGKPCLPVRPYTQQQPGGWRGKIVMKLQREAALTKSRRILSCCEDDRDLPKANVHLPTWLLRAICSSTGRNDVAAPRQVVRQAVTCSRVSM